MKHLRAILLLFFGAAAGLGIVSALVWAVMAFSGLAGDELVARIFLGMLGLLALLAAGAGLLWILSALFHVFAASIFTVESLFSRIESWKKRKVPR